MNIRMTLATSTALAMGLALPALAQQTDSLFLGRIIVGYDAQGGAIYGGENTSVISGQALSANGGFTSLDEVVRQTPGVSTLMNEGQPGVAISVRGLQGSRVEATIEGVPQNFRFTAHNSADGFAYVDPLMLSSISVTRGTSTTEGGLAGAVDFRLLSAADIIKDGNTKGAMLRMRYGDNGKGLAGLAAVAMAEGPVDLAFAVSGRNLDPYVNGADSSIDASGQKGGSVMLRGSWQATEALKLNILATRYSTDYMSQYKMSFGPGMPPTVLAEYQHKVVNDIFSLGFSYEGDDALNLTGSVYSGTTSHEHASGIGSAVGRYMQTETTGIKLQNVSTLELGDWTLVSTNGFDISRDALSGRQNAAGTINGVNPVRGTAENAALFSENVFSNGPLEMMLGLRYSKYQLEGALTDSTGGGAVDHDYRVRSESLDPKLSLAYQLTDTLQPYVSVYQSTRGPSMQEAFLGGGDPSVHGFGYIGNPDLVPEVSRGYELGLNVKRDGLLQADDQLTARINYYNLNVDDYILHRMIEDDPATPARESGMQFVNIGDKVKAQGLELEVGYHAKAFSAVLSWAHTDAKYGGGRLTPKNTVSATLAAHFMDGALTTGTTFVYNSNGAASIAFEDDADRAAYRTVDLFAEYKVNDMVALNAKIANVTDELYTPWAATANIGPGRSAYIGGEIRF